MTNVLKKYDIMYKYNIKGYKIMEVIIKHEMDKDERKMDLNDAFLEALSLSEGRACEIEKEENDLEEYLKNHKNFINNITDAYKISVLKGWNYSINKI